MNMNILKYFLMIIIYTFSADKIIGLTLEKLIEYSKSRFIRVFNENPEIIILGNSRGMTLLNEQKWDDMYNKESVNLSFNSLSASEIILFTQEFSSHEITIFVELSSFFAKDIGIRDDFRIIASKYKHLNLYFDEEDYYRSLPHKLFWCLKFNNIFSMRMFYHLFKSDKNHTNYRSINQSIINNIESSERESIKLSPKFYEYVDLIKELNKTNVIFFLAPYHPIKLSKFNNLKETLEKIKSSGIKTIDLSNILSDDIFFSDGTHTNINASKFLNNQIFINSLK